MFRNLPIANFRREDLLALGDQMVNSGSRPRESNIPAGYITWASSSITTSRSIRFPPCNERMIQRDWLITVPHALIWIACIAGGQMINRTFMSGTA